MNPALASQCEFFYNLGLWAGLPPSQVEQWLSNFQSAELPFAEALVESLVYINGDMVERLFSSAFHNLSGRIGGSGDYATRQAAWQRFRDEVVVTHVTGETPNPSDSGYTFARLARRAWSIDESHILGPDQALRDQLTNSPAPLIFVDDFCGSGQQFLRTWQRPVPVGTGLHSFESAAAQGLLGDIFYCLPVITQYALERLEREAPGVIVQPAHVLPSEYGGGHAASLLFPDYLLAGKDQFLLDVTLRAFGPDMPPLGFHDLGLAVAFQDSTPDACLPMLWKDVAGWDALVPRR